MKIGTSKTTKNFYCPIEFKDVSLREVFDFSSDFTEEDYQAMIDRMAAIASEYGLSYYDTIGFVGAVDTELDDDDYEEMFKRMREAQQ